MSGSPRLLDDVTSEEESPPARALPQQRERNIRAIYANVSSSSGGEGAEEESSSTFDDGGISSSPGTLTPRLQISPSLAKQEEDPVEQQQAKLELKQLERKYTALQRQHAEVCQIVGELVGVALQVGQPVLESIVGTEKAESVRLLIVQYEGIVRRGERAGGIAEEQFDQEDYEGDHEERRDSSTGGRKTVCRDWLGGY